MPAHLPAVQDELEVEPETEDAGDSPNEREPARAFDSDETLREIDVLVSTLEQSLATVHVLRARWGEMQEALEETRSRLDESRALEATAEQHRQLAEELKRLVRDYGSESTEERSAALHAPASVLRPSLS